MRVVPLRSPTGAGSSRVRVTEQTPRLATGNQIGNGSLNGRNTIAGNNGDGIFIGTGTVGTQILANWIGVGFVAADATLGNNLAGGEGGIVVNGGTDTTIGGIGDDGNLIANNKSGVVVVSGTENRVVENVIRDNVDRGIAIAGVGANDPDDLDEGANRGQNHPVLTSAAIASGNLVIDYSIDTVDGEAYPITVEFFEADSGVSGEGERFLRRETVAAPGPTSISFLVGTIVGGDPIVATATDASGNTSTFSNVAVVGGSDALVSSNVGERFGQAVALEGNRMAVSAPNADVRAPLLDVVAPNAGLVYIYERSAAGSPWVLTATLASPSPEFGARFGNAVDLRGDLLAVGEAARIDEGRVWVFRINGGVWSQLGGWIEAELDGFGNEFGASIAWTGDNSLAIGAPGAVGGQGRVYTASLSSGEGGSWVVGNPLSADFGGPPPPGAQLGFAVAFDDSAAGDGRLVAGAPGASRRYSWGPGVFGNPGVAQFDVGWNMGSAVDISGGRVVTGGISDRLRVNVNESLPVQRSNTTNLGPVVAAGPLNATVNDYLDIQGQNVAVSRGGGGGQVEIYGINGLLTLENLTTYAPPASPGDLAGWAIELDGSSLIAGAPGTSADAGAVYSTLVSVAPPSDDPIVVDSLLDTVADDGLCTLREAITAANSDTAANGCIAGSGADTINFAVSGTIVLDTRLPIITSDITIDGASADITLTAVAGAAPRSCASTAGLLACRTCSSSEVTSRPAPTCRPTQTTPSTARSVVPCSTTGHSTSARSPSTETRRTTVPAQRSPTGAPPRC